MTQRIIEVTVSPTGETTVPAKGYAGADCLQASKFLEQSLGLTVNETKTTEFYQTTERHEQVRQ